MQRCASISRQEEFKKYDKDESGYLTRDEIVDMLKDNGGR